jgi:hypothetical protein
MPLSLAPTTFVVVSIFAGCHCRCDIYVYIIKSNESNTVLTRVFLLLSLLILGLVKSGLALPKSPPNSTSFVLGSRPPIQLSKSTRPHPDRLISVPPRLPFATKNLLTASKPFTRPTSLRRRLTSFPKKNSRELKKRLRT